MNLIELLILIALLALSVALGNYASKYLGWAAFVPAGFFASILAFVAIAGFVNTAREAIHSSRNRH